MHPLAGTGRLCLLETIFCGIVSYVGGIEAGSGMDVRVRVAGGGDGELAGLAAWLSGEDELRGRVRIVRRPVGDTQLGSLPELLTVALGAGGAGTALATSLKTWLSTRRTSARITVETGEHSISLDIQTVNDVAPLLEQILKAGDGG